MKVLILLLHFFYASSETTCPILQTIPDTYTSSCDYDEKLQLHIAPCKVKAIKDVNVIIVNGEARYSQEFVCITDTNGTLKAHPENVIFRNGCLIKYDSSGYPNMTVSPRDRCELIRKNSSFLVDESCTVVLGNNAYAFEHSKNKKSSHELKCSQKTLVKVVPYRCRKPATENILFYREGCFLGSRIPYAECIAECHPGYQHVNSTSNFFRVTCDRNTEALTDNLICKEIIKVCRNPIKNWEYAANFVTLMNCRIDGTKVNAGCRFVAKTGHKFTMSSVRGDYTHMISYLRPACDENQYGNYWNNYVTLDKVCETTVIPDQDNRYNYHTHFIGCREHDDKIQFTSNCNIRTTRGMQMSVNEKIITNLNLTCEKGVPSVKTITFLGQNIVSDGIWGNNTHNETYA